MIRPVVRLTQITGMGLQMKRQTTVCTAKFVRSISKFVLSTTIEPGQSPNFVLSTTIEQ